jgi:hypothetical protein
MSHIVETNNPVDKYCKGGATVLYYCNLLGGHNDNLWAGRLRTLNFLAHVLEVDNLRVKLVSGCNITVPIGSYVTQNVSVPLNVLDLSPDWWLTGTP